MKPEPDLLLEKGVPVAVESEQIVLGAALKGHPFANIAVALQASDFGLEKHRRIFQAMAQLEAAGSPVNHATVGNELMRLDQLESVDGFSYLVSLDENLPTLATLDACIQIVHEKSIMRRAIYAHQAAIDELLLAADPTNEILERAERTIAELNTKMRSGDSFRAPAEVLERAGGLTALVNPDRSASVATPWPNLNGVLVNGGFQPGQMIVIGARPLMGKTAMACQIADSAASAGIGAAFFSLEMADSAILLRMAAARAQVDSIKLTHRHATPVERHAINRAFGELTDPENCGLWLDDTSASTVPSMRAALRRLTARHPIGLVVVDYLQLVETSGGNRGTRNDQVTEISRGLKRLAREFKVPVVVLSQLSRESEKESRRPRLSDLRDSGSIEQDADVILLPALQSGQDEQADVLAMDLIVAKQRNGPRCIVKLKFLRRFAKFVEPGMEEARVA